MLFRNRLLLLTIVVTVAVAYGTAAPAPQAGQDIRITNGPVIEEATSNAAVIAWSTDVPSSSRVWYGTEKNNLTHSAEAPDNGSKTHRVRNRHSAGAIVAKRRAQACAASEPRPQASSPCATRMLYSWKMIGRLVMWKVER